MKIMEIPFFPPASIITGQTAERLGFRGGGVGMEEYLAGNVMASPFFNHVYLQ